MNREKPKRLRWDFPQRVEIPSVFRRYLWEYQKEAPLEILVLRVLTYGDFQELRELYDLYPRESLLIALKYPNVKRGVRYWLKRWSKKGS